MYLCVCKSVNKLRHFKKSNCNNTTVVRTISNAEIATALRPFYFAVHPDLFGRYPEQRTVNEDSLKQLSAFLESVYKQRSNTAIPKNIPFYVRSSEIETKGTFKLVSIPLERNGDPKKVLKVILKAANLPTEYVDKIKSEPSASRTSSSDATDEHHRHQPGGYTYEEQGESFDESMIFGKIRSKKEEQHLQSWIEQNATAALFRKHTLQELKDEIIKLQDAIILELKVKELRYDCGWNVEHYRGCLKSLESLLHLHKDVIKGLEGRVIVFAQFTGVSLDGHIMLFTGDVPTNWLELLRHLPEQDAHLKKIPAYEDALRQVLRNIRIRRRKFMPKTHASEYTSHLRKVITSLLDYLSKAPFPETWPESLEDYELVVESEAGPLMINPTGQIIVPATCPGSIIVDFMTNHLDEAKTKADDFKRTKYVEIALINRAIAELKLSSLKKDDSIAPATMIACLERLIESKLELYEIDLLITNYYSVMSDGTVCIPWNCKL